MKLFLVLFLVVFCVSYANTLPAWTDFETELSPETARYYTNLKSQGLPVPLRWSDTHRIIARTPEILIRIGKMNSPIDRHLFIEGVPYTVNFAAMPVDDYYAQKLVDYLGDPELQPSRALEIFFENTRSQEKNANETNRVALEIDRNMDRALNLLLIHEAQNKQDSYVMRGLLARLKNEVYQIPDITNAIVLPDYLKLLAKYLSNAQRSSFGERDLRYAIDTLSEFPPERVFLVFNYNNISTSSVYARNGYADFRFKLAHLLKDMETVFKQSKLSSENLLKVIIPILRTLESSFQDSSSLDLRISLQTEILEIAKNALALVDISQNDFYTRSLSGHVNRASRKIKDLTIQKEKVSYQLKLNSSKQPSLDEQKLIARAKLDDALKMSYETSIPIDLANIKFSIKRIRRQIEGENFMIYTIPYTKAGMSSSQPAYNLTWFLPEYQHGVFVLEHILNKNYDGWVLWDRNIPESVKNLPGLEIKPFGVKNVLIRLSGLVCARYFQ